MLRREAFNLAIPCGCIFLNVGTVYFHNYKHPGGCRVKWDHVILRTGQVGSFLLHCRRICYSKASCHCNPMGTVLQCDLFKAPAEYALAHCVFADLPMINGLVGALHNTFGQLEKLRKRDPHVRMQHVRPPNLEYSSCGIRCYKKRSDNEISIWQRSERTSKLIVKL